MAKRKAAKDTRWFRVTNARFNPTHAEFEVDANATPTDIENAALDAITINMDWRMEEIDGEGGKVIGDQPLDGD